MMMMTRSGMEVLSPNSTLFSNPNCFVVGGDKRSTGKWTQQENKMFENALAHIDFQSPDMWDRLAQLLPGKTVRDIISHYRDLVDDVNHIEAGGLIQFPGYTASSSSSPSSSSSSSSFTLHWESGFDGIKQEEGYCVGSGGKRSGGRLFDQERKKGVPWTEEEHKLFLMGLKKYGKGDWRNISRNSVVTRTPTQVASHAQKYFIRLNSGGKDKRRASIHDITTVNLPDNSPPSPSQPSAISMQSTNSSINQPNEAASGFTPLKQNNRFVHLPYGINPYGVKLEGHHSHIAATVLDSMFVHRTYA